MKKLVLFTLVLVVCLSGSAFALLNDNAVAVDDAQAASDNGVNVDASKAAVAAIGAQSATTGGKNTNVDVDVDVQGNAIATKGAQAATNGGTNLNVEDSLNNNKVAFNGGEIAGRDTNPDNRTYNVVDNAILANVNYGPGAIAFTPGAQTQTFIKTQSASISGSFSGDGVSNTNSAAGNFNNQKAGTSIAVSYASSGGGHH